MARSKVRTFDKLAAAVADPDERLGPGVTSLGVFDADDDPIHVRLHLLPAGAEVCWPRSRRGHLAYVWEGVVEVGDTRLERGAIIIVEHLAGATVRADGPATLLVFGTSDASADVPRRAGGHVHLLAEAAAPTLARVNERSNVGVTLHADSSCGTCELWLHGNDFRDADFAVAPHYHSEDEVIVVTGGQIVLGARRYGRGCAIAVQRDTVYGFRTGPKGMSFINFRAAHPSYGLAGQAEPVDERAFYKALPSPTFAQD